MNMNKAIQQLVQQWQTVLDDYDLKHIEEPTVGELITHLQASGYDIPNVDMYKPVWDCAITQMEWEMPNDAHIPHDIEIPYQANAYSGKAIEAFSIRLLKKGL